MSDRHANEQMHDWSAPVNHTRELSDKSKMSGSVIGHAKYTGHALW